MAQMSGHSRNSIDQLLKGNLAEPQMFDSHVSVGSKAVISESSWQERVKAAWVKRQLDTNPWLQLEGVWLKRQQYQAI